MLTQHTTSTTKKDTDIPLISLTFEQTHFKPFSNAIKILKSLGGFSSIYSKI